MKPWYKSSTIWINLAGILALVIDFIVRSNAIPDADVIAILVAIANILNRLRAPITVEKLSWK
jgi:uncharacterized membrane protein